MKHINGIALTEKGVLKTAVRNAIKSKDNAELEPVLTEIGFDYVEDKNAYVLAREDNNGNAVYTVLTMTISTKHPSELAERKPKAKKPTESQEVEVE
jgi:hypothetical protein